MKNIVFATDMSSNSRAALRFALQMAEASGAKLHVVHVFYVMRASMWQDPVYEQHRAKTRSILLPELKAFAKSAGAAETQHCEIDLYHHYDTVEGILEFARMKQADCICIGTHGAGLLKKLLGSNAASLIGKSKIPVLGIPAHYRTKRLQNVLYACDMENYEAELKQVMAFAQPLNLSVQLLHLYPSYEFIPDIDLMEQTASRKAGGDVKVTYEQRNADVPLLEDVNAAVKKLKPSVLAMFTNQERDFMEKLLLPSTTKDYSFISKVPLLSFGKSKASTETKKKKAAPVAK